MTYAMEGFANLIQSIN
jgi:importin subunit alpha-1